MHLQKSVQYYAETRILKEKPDSNVVLYKETGIRHNVSDLRDLRLFCHNLPKTTGVDKGTYKIYFAENIIFKDTDTKSVIAHAAGEHFSFIFSTNGKLLYVQDIPKLFETFDTSKLGLWHTLCPIYLQTFDGQDVRWKVLTEKDTVVDKNLHQIWPIHTGRTPVFLRKILGYKCDDIRIHRLIQTIGRIK